MRAALTVAGILAMSFCAWGKGADAPAPKPAVTIVRDLALVPPGRYRMVQAWEMTGTQTNQFGNGAKTEKKVLSLEKEST